MDRPVILEKLESLRLCLDRIRSRCPDSVAALEADIDAQDIVSLNLTRTVQLAVDIATHLLSSTDQQPPATMGESFDLLADAGMISFMHAATMKAAVGFRNVAVHSYRKIDWAIVFNICNEHLDDFDAFAGQVLKHLDAR